MSRPVMIDLETRSLCDLKTAGGYVYAKHESTRLLTVSWSAEPGRYHVWFPTLARHPDAKLIHQLRDSILVGVEEIYTDEGVPDALRALTNREWAAHNAWTFDQQVWQALFPDVEPEDWIDTYPLALAAGLPGQLNQIGVRLWGEGKYEAGNALMTKHSHGDGRTGVDVPPAVLAQIGVYNVQDVRLLDWLWEELTNTLRLPDTEKAVLRAHRRINEAGTRVDREMLSAVQELTRKARLDAIREIRTLVPEAAGNDDQTLKWLRSGVKVKAWLKSRGFDLGKSLAKEVIARFVEQFDGVGGDDEPDDEDDCQEETEGFLTPEQRAALPAVVRMLQLRTACLRVTEGKLKAAVDALEFDRLRGLYAYWAAHTGRWAGRRVQVHNLPRPKEGVDVWGLVGSALTGDLTIETVRGFLRPPKGKLLTPDDAASALIRCVFVPDEGHELATADYSNIEGRVLAGLADEQWLIEAFRKCEDPYLLTAARIYGKKPEDWPGVREGLVKIKKHDWRQTGKVVELGCGYGLGALRFEGYAAGMGVNLIEAGVTADECIEAYRASHPAIAGTVAGVIAKGPRTGQVYRRGGYWYKLEDAARACVRGEGTQEVCRTRFFMHRGHLYVELPSGRRLVYRAARELSTPRPDSKISGSSVVYESARFRTTYMYGGKWAENIVQAVSRDLLANAIVLCHEAGLKVVLHVHDEVGVSIPPSRFGDFMRCMTTLPDWAAGWLPLDAEGGLMPRYAKSPPPGVKEVVWRDGRPL